MEVHRLLNGSRQSSSTIPSTIPACLVGVGPCQTDGEHCGSSSSGLPISLGSSTSCAGSHCAPRGAPLDGPGRVWWYHTYLPKPQHIPNKCQLHIWTEVCKSSTCLVKTRLCCKTCTYVLGQLFEGQMFDFGSLGVSDFMQRWGAITGGQVKSLPGVRVSRIQIWQKHGACRTHVCR